MSNLQLWDKVASVPVEAQKPITAGRLKGMTDINPMWRIKMLTEIYGICGIGWKATIKNKWLDVGANNEVVANVEIELFVRDDKGNWSEGIQGIGGSMFVTNETRGLHTSDEAYKMAYTDAISVACKMLGFGSDIYWAQGKTKYSNTAEPEHIAKLRFTMNDKIKKGMGKNDITNALKTFVPDKEWYEYSKEEAEKAVEFLKVLAS